MRKLILLLLMICGSCFAVASHTVKLLPFKENQVVNLNASTFTVTEVKFGVGEKIKSIQNGDLAAWTVDVSKNLSNTLFIKPTIAGSNTNMTVITNRHTYYFHLSSSNDQGGPLYAIKFRYHDKESSVNLLNEPQLPTDYNWDYSFNGSKSVMPLHVFDDGRFTYFQLRPGQSLPAIFVVDTRSGDESVVNFRRENQYLVVHRLAPQFTLRAGAYQVASIFNNVLIRGHR